MTDIRTVRAYFFGSDRSGSPGYFESGLTLDGRYYFRNAYLEIPNEFETCPAFYPKLFFASITKYLDDLALWDANTGKQPLWHFELFKANGEHVLLTSSNPSNQLLQYLNYNNFLSFTTGEWDCKAVFPPRTTKVSLDDIRGEVALGRISFRRFMKDRLDSMLRGTYRDSVLEKKDGSIEILIEENRLSNEKLSSVVISSDGEIKSSGGVLYADILQENRVKIFQDSDKMSGTIRFPKPDEKTRRFFLDPNYLVDEDDAEYSFTGEEEQSIFCEKYQNIGEVIIASPDVYVSLYNKAFDEYDAGHYTTALQLYFKALKKNPIGIDARFEIANCYVKMREYRKALCSLAVIKDLIYTDEQIARFYRTLGFIYSEIDNPDFFLAYSCYKHSKSFGSQGAFKKEAENELIYMTAMAGQQGGDDPSDWGSFDTVRALNIYGIPVLPSINNRHRR